MLQAQAKGLCVVADTRNTKVVAYLIGAMTLGAVILLWSEPPTPGWSAEALLMAESVRGISEVQIDYVAADDRLPAEEYDCLILPDGACQWQPRGPRIRLGVVGSAGSRLPSAQARTLLTAFGAMTQRHGLDLRHVWLHPASDARLHPELPPAAHDLVRLLVRKRIVP